MKKTESPKGLLILITIIAILLIATHGEDLNKIPGVQVEGGGVTVDIGDYHYYTEGA